MKAAAEKRFYRGGPRGSLRRSSSASYSRRSYFEAMVMLANSGIQVDQSRSILVAACVCCCSSIFGIEVEVRLRPIA
jgi:hypothetical protein